MLFFPLFCYFLLVYHHTIGAVLVRLVPFSHLKHHLFQMGDLAIGLVYYIVDTLLRILLIPCQVTQRRVFIFAQAVSELFKTLIFVK